jgi:hypothetical protein
MYETDSSCTVSDSVPGTSKSMETLLSEELKGISAICRTWTVTDTATASYMCLTIPQATESFNCVLTNSSSTTDARCFQHIDGVKRNISSNYNTDQPGKTDTPQNYRSANIITETPAVGKLMSRNIRKDI